MNYMDYLEKMTKMVCDSMKVKKIESRAKPLNPVYDSSCRDRRLPQGDRLEVSPEKLGMGGTSSDDSISFLNDEDLEVMYQEYKEKQGGRI